MIYVDPKILDRVNQWLTPVFDIDTQHRIKEMIAYDPEGLEDSFYKDLEFGTGGMRGIMGVGDNRINKYTLGKNSQGLSNYLKKVFPGQDLKVAIAYDCRKNSRELARVVAEVFSANEIDVYLFSDLRPTPELSFAVRNLGCHCGIVLTASHNPPEYNGYKVYWQDGGQLVPPQDQEIIKEIQSVAYANILFDFKPEKIHLIDNQVDQAFVKASLENGCFATKQQQREALKVVFTPLHGTSITMVPQVLQKAGYTQLHIVKEQAEPDGSFPTVASPNPEEPEALKIAMEQARELEADIVIGTDPDCDRLGIAARSKDGTLKLLNGNQAMVLMTHFLLEQWKSKNRLTDRQFVASTIVSTPMVEVIANDFGVAYQEGLTGFKWIAKMVKDQPGLELIGGGEESFGYMVGDFVRDKDAVTATLLACEIAAIRKASGSTLWEYLEDLYKKYGYFREALVSFVKKGKKGAEEIDHIMNQLRSNPPTLIDGSAVNRIQDYKAGKEKRLSEGKEQDLSLPSSNVLIFYTEDGSKIAARPSGTEPKIKYYISVKGDQSYELLGEKIERIKTEFNL
jgi:phosphomannomutase